jgi:hypothetical protein
MLKTRESTYKVVRDNVNLELGIFVGNLGIKRCFIVAPREEFNFHLPTDLNGLTLLKFKSGREDGNLKAALGPCVSEIKKVIQRCGTIKSQLSASIKDSLIAFKSPEAFYENLIKANENAKQRIWLMNLQDYSPYYYGGKNRINYYDSLMKITLAKENVDVRRIMRIPTIEKLEWLKKLIKETEHISNFHIAYLNNSSRCPKSLMISVQIIDDQIAFLINPQKNTSAMIFNQCYQINNHEIVCAYIEYYMTLWDEIIGMNNINGFTIKNGVANLDYSNIYKRIEDNITNVV